MIDFVMVPVPEDRVQDVYSLLAKRIDPEIRPIVEASSDKELSSDWTDDEVIRAYSEAPGTVQTVLQILAQNPGEKFHSKDLYRELNYSKNQWSGVMGAFGKKVKGRYGKSVKPFEEVWDEDANSMRYEMRPEVAKVIVDAMS